MYGQRYYFTVASKNETATIAYTVEIWEKDYTGYVDQFDTGPDPLIGQVLTSSDDPYEPMVPATRTILIDITDFTGVLPDFETRDDRTYWVKIYANGTTYYDFQGFILMDGVSVPFTTGRIFLQIICVDGIALLESIPYVPSDVDFNESETLSTMITNCLNLLALPDGYFINYACNIRAQGQSTGASVFYQSYLKISTWLKSDLTYESCFYVLQEIARSFACQFYQSNGEWWMGNVNDRAADGLVFFQTDQDNGTETQLRRSRTREIMPYSDVPTTPWYFQENRQTKIIRKGYPIIELNHEFTFLPNGIYNGNLEIQTVPGTPDKWTTFSSGTTTLSLIRLGAYLYWTMGVSGVSGAINQVNPDSISPGFEGDQITLSFSMQSAATSSPGLPSMQYRVRLDDGATGYALLEDGSWAVDSGQFIDVFNSSNGTITVSNNSNPLPASGTFIILFRIKQGTTINNVFIGNFILSYSSQYQNQLVRATVSESSYKKRVDILLGAQSDTNGVGRGALLDASGIVLTNWYRDGITEAYSNLMRLIIQQYVNVISKAQYNFDMTQRGLFDDRFSVGPVIVRRPHILSIADSVTVNDSTTNSLSVNGKYYMLGAMNLNFTEDTMTGTLLEISNVDLSATITNETIPRV